MPTEKIGTTRSNDNTATERNLSFIIVMGLAVNLRKNSRIDLCYGVDGTKLGNAMMRTQIINFIDCCISFVACFGSVTFTVRVALEQESRC
jgi:hypothetical protein|eukprot:scaffold1576_cov192-Alexandrium_tamarense.AAC.11